VKNLVVNMLLIFPLLAGAFISVLTVDGWQQWTLYGLFMFAVLIHPIKAWYIERERDNDD